MMDFKNAKELLTFCQNHDLPISEIMRQREIIIGQWNERRECKSLHGTCS